jgi:hypothetical protein
VPVCPFTTHMLYNHRHLQCLETFGAENEIIALLYIKLPGLEK